MNQMMMPLKGKRIFIVEDNIPNRTIMQLSLEYEGAKTGIERWGTDTLERLQRFAPVDVILLDLMLPNNITGYDIFEQIRALPAFDAVPIVAVSASDPAVAIPRTQSMGFVGFIRKPINQNLFPRQILSIIEGEQIWERI
jgi:CheY-like chemotaxis protein